MTKFPNTIEIIVRYSDLFHYQTGVRITWGLPLVWYQRIWRWLLRRNYRVARVDFDRSMLVVARCR